MSLSRSDRSPALRWIRRHSALLLAPAVLLWPVIYLLAASSAHWAFQPLERPEKPVVEDSSWVSNPIDRFVLARLEEQGIAPSPEAGKTTLIRRVHLDLIGLPPTPAEVDAFLSDTSPDAYGNLLDRLLDSPHYGEKWGRHWLDHARYADSHGFRGDPLRPHAWRYRDWVINAFNADIPFDQFTVEQMAGDLLPNRTTEQHVATGFHRNTPTNTEGGSDPEEWRVEQVVNRVNTVGTVWLGLTVGCAQCHDHKYDPITQKQYYELFAFFNDAEEVDIDAPLSGERGPYYEALSNYRRERERLLREAGVFDLKPPWEKKLLYHADNPGESAPWDITFDELRTAIDLGETILRTPPAERTVKWEKRLTRFFIYEYKRVLTKDEWEKLDFVTLRERLDALDRSLPPFSEAQAIHVERNPRKTNVLLRGSYKDLGIEVQPGVPDWLHDSRVGGRLDRIDLGRWLVSDDNPLTWRVTVNRIWQELFGRGLVATPEDFGAQGEKPSHPELLDWLASEFNRTLSFKQIIRTIMMSSAYRQSSNTRPDLIENDPGNALVARQGRFRLPAELIRDSAMAVSGLLYPKIGGRSIRPPRPAGATRMGSTGGGRWKVSQGRDRYRRGLYIQFHRIEPYAQLANFDMPGSYEAACRRRRSNTPLQALNLLNDAVFIEAAQSLAFRTLAEAQGDADRIRFAFRLCLARDPDPLETDWLSTSFDRQKKILEQDPERAETLFPLEMAGVNRLEGAAWVGLGSVLLNLDEFITRE